MAERAETLLVVEDDPGLQSQLRWSFESFEVSVAADRESALAEFRRSQPAVVTLDLGLPPDPGGVREGFAVLEAIVEASPDTKVIVVTGHNDRSNAVRAIGRGAYDFLEKPVDAALLGMAVERAARVFKLEEENRRLSERRGNAPLDGLIAASPEMLKVASAVERLAPTDVSVLVLGESGTGKELVVRSLHALSDRSAKRLVAINCAAIPETLLESELFGYEKGAFTGAAKTTPGKIELASGGMLFLDEIGDLSQALQAKLLRFLQERVIERVGGRQEIPVDVRVVCATHQDLAELIRQGSFREDLYYRVNEATIRVPPLRDRQGDAALLARVFLRRVCDELKRSNIKGFSEAAVAAIERYGWPGNVRELESRVKRAAIMGEGPLITPEELELVDVETSVEALNLRTIREAAETRTILRALGRTGQNVAQAAELLGVTRPTLYTLLRKYDIPY